MHIRTLKRVQTPGGPLVEAGVILDLPEAEAAPLVEAGTAELLDPPAAAEQPEPKGDGKQAEPPPA
jgi:hypothetical protein